jgi:ribonuclease HI
MGSMTPTPDTQAPPLASQPPAPAVWRAWFDGSAAPNPGKIGVGVVLIAPDARRMEKSLPLNRCGCNNEAELLALSLVLDMAEAAGAKALEIFGDSKATADWIRGADSTRIEPIASLVAGIRARIIGFDNVELVWIPRHKNIEADRLSRRALGLPEGIPPPAKKRRDKRR